jgi:hypothetical protein
MTQKAIFYQAYGVEEYYIYDPDDIELTGLIRSGDWLEPVEEMNGWTSPRLGIRFELKEDTLEIYRPDGQKFLTSVELDQLREQERQRAEEERQRADEERQRADEERQRAEEERQRAEEERQRADDAIANLAQEQQRYQALLDKLRERGINPEQL